MHICFLTNEFPKKGEAHGGIGTFIKSLAENLVTKEITVSVVGINSTSSEESYTENNIKIYRLAKSNWKFGKFYQQNYRVQNKLKEIHLQNPIDIVEGSELSFAFSSKKTIVGYERILK